MTETARAKINLFLHCGERRTDGFHPLQSLAVFTELGDRLTAEPGESLSLQLQGPFAAGLAAEATNLVLRAGRALAGAAGVPAQARLTLTKNRSEERRVGTEWRC